MRGQSMLECVLHSPLRCHQRQLLAILSDSPEGWDPHGPEAQRSYTCSSGTVASCDVENCFLGLRVIKVHLQPVVHIRSSVQRSRIGCRKLDVEKRTRAPVACKSLPMGIS